MKQTHRFCALTLIAWLLCSLMLIAQPASAQTAGPRPTSADLPNETPDKFEEATDSFNYVKRDMMIPMRDGVKLHTVILVPKGVKGAPVLLTRTPYDATALTSHAQSAHLGPVLQGYDNGRRNNRRGQLHPRSPRRAGQVRLRGRLCDDPPLTWAAEFDSD